MDMQKLANDLLGAAATYNATAIKPRLTFDQLCTWHIDFILRIGGNSSQLESALRRFVSDQTLHFAGKPTVADQIEGRL